MRQQDEPPVVLVPQPPPPASQLRARWNSCLFKEKDRVETDTATRSPVIDGTASPKSKTSGTPLFAGPSADDEYTWYDETESPTVGAMPPLGLLPLQPFARSSPPVIVGAVGLTARARFAEGTSSPRGRDVDSEAYGINSGRAPGFASAMADSSALRSASALRCFLSALRCASASSTLKRSHCSCRSEDCQTGSGRTGTPTTAWHGPAARGFCARRRAAEWRLPDGPRELRCYCSIATSGVSGQAPHAHAASSKARLSCTGVRVRACWYLSKPLKGSAPTGTLPQPFRQNTSTSITVYCQR